MRHLRAAICWLFLSLYALSAASADSPNVVLFFVDDLGWTDWQYDATINPTGSPVYETPNMLRLAESGLTFTQGYASTPVCSSTRSSLMTGKNAARTNFTDHTGGGNNTSATLQSPRLVKAIPFGEVTIAEALGSPAGGYNTGYVGKWHAGAGPTSHGYDFNIAGGGSGCPCGDGFFAGADGRWNNMPGLGTPGAYPADAYLSDVLADFAEGFIETRSASSDPFFLTMAPYLVHVPLQAPAPLVTKYTDKINTLVGNGADLRGHDNATYAAMVEKMDEALGRVLDRLEDPNGDGDTADSVRDDTIVLFASDNGGLTVSELGYAPATDVSPLREGKGSLYEGGVRSPFIASWTGNANIAQGGVTAARVASHDIYPTLLELTGLDDNPSVPRNTEIDGVSFAAALEGGVHDRGYQVWHYPNRSNQDKVGGSAVVGGSFVSSIRDDNHKVIYFYETGESELYNLTTDLGESVDLVDLEPAKAFELSIELHGYLKRVGASTPLLRSTGAPVPLPEVLWLTTEGDFDLGGAVDAADWQRLKANFFADLTELSAFDAYAMGDINLDGVVDRLDFADFQVVYDATNGAGAFAAMVRGVPEPSGLKVVAMTFGVGFCRRRSRGLV